jgi:hypothetical protein
VLKSETYILEHTQAFFTWRSDMPCWGAVRFEPTDSGAAHFSPAVSGATPLRAATSTAEALSPIRSGADPSASAMAGVG